MMNLDRMQDILDTVTYKDWHIGAYPDRDGAYLQVRFYAADTTHHAFPNHPELQAGRKWRLSEHMTHSEVVQTALKAVLAAEEHETREQFHYRGRAIFGPHFNVDVLHAVCEADEHVDVRVSA